MIGKYSVNRLEVCFLFVILETISYYYWNV